MELAWGHRAVHDAVLELSELLAPLQVIPEWEVNARPRFPMHPALSSGRCMIISPTLGHDALGLKALEYIDWRDHGEVGDVAIAGSVEAVQQVRAAKLIVIYGQPVAEAFVNVSALRRDLYAQSVVHVQADGERAAAWLQEVVELWVASGHSLLDAMQVASMDLGLKTLILSSTQSFIVGANASYARFKNPNRI